ncbi:protein-glutamine gamma-glutamyltransferase K [Latimeria chalumnae]|uniref:Protein-glutamine gamma-glutamyltransferase K n=1 Tax=Latimeria chalumnae TaxID=7897 RepID=H3A051_LATCH|nr:PREDICTED: protein-glutamine gamma-glutamyltransferase K-like [Latimeria chalumnae]|eukprot:XP_006008136.1 PREDICTED: protein-glutamine gamma-glutamyltransferase K-like [Latimeria chalumnae]
MLSTKSKAKDDPGRRNLGCSSNTQKEKPKLVQEAASLQENKEDEVNGAAEQKENLLKVKNIDLLKKPEEINKKSHHTDEYEYDELIIRRGQPFQVKLEFSRPFNPETDKLFLELKLGSQPQVGKGTHVIVKLVEKHIPSEWGAKIIEASGNTLTLSINSSPQTMIGRFELTVKTVTEGGAFKMKYNRDNDIYFLFNPWCEADTVYMEDEEWRKEYVLNDTGRLYYGTENSIGSRTWCFAQFEKGILEACFYLLDKGGMPDSGRGDPISVVRVISAMVNSQDDDGVLVGSWSGVYWDGRRPTSWTGSSEILLHYHDSYNPVRYGQCWVFSGVATTVLRCLGIPGRSVTNFSSAHDSDTSLEIDYYIDEDHCALDHLNNDSIWNFHVWNECWMARPDLPQGYGGWQVVDATPQETSAGTYCCGPASVRAIKNGLVYLKYDAPFIFAEVNSDKVYWIRDSNGDFKRYYSARSVVGHNISTKAVGSEERLDITNLYKYPEGSEEERLSVKTACKFGNKSKMSIEKEVEEDVVVEVEITGNDLIGSNIIARATVTNRGNNVCNICLFMRAAMTFYTGVYKNEIKNMKEEVTLEPAEVKEVKMTIKYDEYDDYLEDQACIMFTLMGLVSETKQIITKQRDYRLRTPDLMLKVHGEVVKGKESKVVISFVNPLPKVLKNVVIHLEGPGLQKRKTISVGEVAKQGLMTITEIFIPSKAGCRKLIANLDCHQLTQVHGVVEVEVINKPAEV